MWREAALGFAILLLLVPLSAEARAATGTAEVEGAVVFHDQPLAKVAPLFAYASSRTLTGADPLVFTTLRIQAAHAEATRVTHQTTQLPGGPAVGIGVPTVETWTLDDLMVEGAWGSRPGVVGFLPHGPLGLARLDAEDVTVTSEKTYEANPHGLSNPQPYEFYAKRMSPTMVAQGKGVLHYTGDVAIHFYGPSFTLSAAQNVTTEETGRVATSPATGRAVTLVLKLTGAEVRMESGSPWVLGSEDAQVTTDGALTFHALTSVFSSDDAVAHASGLLTLEGALEARLAPHHGEDAVTSLMHVSGDLRPGRLVFTPAAAVATPIAGALWGPLLAFLLGAAVMGGGSYGWWLMHERRHRPPYTPEDCERFAFAHLEAEEYPKALQWLSTARKMAPTSAHLLASAAHVHDCMGDHDEALALLAEAARHDRSGEHDFHAALLCVKAGRSPDEAETWLLRALSRDPSLDLAVVESDELAPLWGRPRLMQALGEARRARRRGLDE